MASELRYTVQFNASKGNASTAYNKTCSVDMAGTDMAQGTYTATTSATALGLPSNIGFPAHVTIANLDSTNYVNVYQDSGALYHIAKLAANGGQCVLPAIAAVPYVKANSASCLLQFSVAEA